MAGPRKKQKKPHHETLAEAVRREQEEDVVRDLRASLAQRPDEDDARAPVTASGRRAGSS